MKIGILTLPFNNNYGGYLQSYALMKVLKDMGHSVELINRRPNKITKSKLGKLKFLVKNFLKSIIKFHKYPLLWHSDALYLYRGKLMHSFVRRNISPISKPLYSSDELKEYCDGRYDAIIVGSDQVWRPIYVPNVNNFFLDFVDDKTIKIAYAASFGTDMPEFSSSQIKEISKSISRFNAISVREKSGINLCATLFKEKKVEVVLDPTLLLSSKVYLDSISSSKTTVESIPGDYFLSYILDKDPNVLETIKNVSKTLHLKPFMINEQTDNGVFPSIESWLNCIKGSSFVITDSFHGMVFSIIFNVPFAVIINKNRGVSRFISLLSLLGLEERVINNESNINSILNHPIKWNDVNKILAKEKERSLNFLNGSLRQF